MSTRLHTADEMQERYPGVPKHRWYAMARGNICPSVRLGRQVRFIPEQIDEWLRSGGQALPGGWRADPPEERQ